MSLITIINQDKNNKKTVPIGTVVKFGTARLANTEPIMRLKLMIYAT